MARPKRSNNDPNSGAAPNTEVPTRTSVSMDIPLHAQLKLVAADETARRGHKVSVADLVAEAAIAMWAPTAYRPGPAATPAIEAERQQMLAEVHAQELAQEQARDEWRAAQFDELLAAALADPIPDVILPLDGALEGTFGPIARRDLAYHLRSALGAGRAIYTLDELVADYQG